MKYIYLFLSFLIVSSLFSQSTEDDYINNPVDEMFPETPDITQFHQHNFLPVNYYTGRTNIQIPIYEITTGSISVPITLDYETGGNKVDQLASRIGLGWTLNAGGSISHIVRGIPDSDFSIFNGPDRRGWSFSTGEPNEVTYSLDRIGYHRRIYDYDDTKSFFNQRTAPLPNNATYQVDEGNLAINNLSSVYDIDAAPDLYHVVAPGLNAKFMVVSDDPIHPQPTTVKGEHNFFNRAFRAVFLDNNSLKMDNNALSYKIFDDFNLLPTGGYDRGPNLRTEYAKIHEARYLEKFKIQNSNGLVYEFEWGNVSESDSKLAKGRINPTAMRGKNYTKRVNSWNLNSITDPVSNQKVEFEYEEYQSATIDSISILSYKSQSILNYISQISIIPTRKRFTDVYQTVYPRLTRLKKIKFDKGEVEFKYDFVREDSYDSRALSEIIIRDIHGKKVKGYILVQGYFDSKEQNCSGIYCKRLKLKEIRVVDNEEDIQLQETLNEYTFLYNENIKLPNSRFSMEKDYMGYYNQNGGGYFSGYSNNGTFWEVFGHFHGDKHLKFYFYPNQKELSLLPFKRKDVTDPNAYREISHFGITLEPDLQGTLATTLRKIVYPTGGSLELEYENNSFHFKGFDYDAPGLRIKKQIKNDGRGKIEEFHYDYLNDSGNSSGTFSVMPAFGFITKIIDLQNMPCTTCQTQPEMNFDIFADPKYKNALTQGNLVGYSKVTEKQIGNGKTVYRFTSPKDFQNTNNYSSREHRHANRTFSSPSVKELFDFLFNNSAYPASDFIDRDVKRGKLIEKEVYNETGNIIFKEKRNYLYNTFDAFYSRHNVPAYPGHPLWTSTNFYDFDYEMSDIITDIYSKIPYHVERNVMTQIERFNYFDTGLVYERENIGYDPYYPFQNQIIKRIGENGQIIDQTIDLTYPHQLSTPEMTALTNLNIISSPVKVEKETGSSKLTTEKTYSLLNGLPYASSIVTMKNQLDSFEEVTYDLYDTTNGNIRQFTSKGEYTTSVIWGYNKAYPIAKIVGLDFNTISSSVNNLQQLSDNDDDRTQDYTGNEGALRQALDNLRTQYPQALITTYTYDPLVGTTSVTDPRGDTVYYVYDKFNRLTHIVDFQGKVIEETKYNYKDFDPYDD